MNRRVLQSAGRVIVIVILAVNLFALASIPLLPWVKFVSEVHDVDGNEVEFTDYAFEETLKNTEETEPFDKESDELISWIVFDISAIKAVFWRSSACMAFIMVGFILEKGRGVARLIGNFILLFAQLSGLFALLSLIFHAHIFLNVYLLERILVDEKMACVSISFSYNYIPLIASVAIIFLSVGLVFTVTIPALRAIHGFFTGTNKDEDEEGAERAAGAESS